MRIRDSLASSLRPKERVMSPAYLSLSARLCTRFSYRDAAETLNLFLHRGGADSVKQRTLSDAMERTGGGISAELARNTGKILGMYGFDRETGLPGEDAELSANIKGSACAMPDIPAVQAAIGRVNAAREEKAVSAAEELDIEPDASECVYVSIDDIGVKHQKDSRAESSSRGAKYVENTVAHIQHGRDTYALTGICMRDVMKSVLAFLLFNGLLGNRLVFFTDGAKNIKSGIEAFFSFRPYTVILDWYHLKKKCQEFLSMALKGRDVRNGVLEKLLRILWAGNVQGAVEYLESLPESMVKSRKQLEGQADYLRRKEAYIACYAVRAELGLRNSSNPVEKENDILVARRQKHNGMSWSKTGSGALAAIEMVFENGEADMWFQKKQIPFMMHQELEPDLCA